MGRIADDTTSQENAERINRRLLDLLKQFPKLEATSGTIAQQTRTTTYTTAQGLNLEALLETGKDLVIQDAAGDVLLYMRWYPFAAARENLQFLPKGIFPETILSADDTGLWFCAEEGGEQG